MEKAELIERLRGYEWNDVEFKRAQRGVPDSAYETVSAFSNTEGGWLVFGIRDGAGGYETVGGPEVDLAVLDGLALQTLISPLEGAETPVFVLAEHLVERLGWTDRADDPIGVGASGMVTDQAGSEPERLVTGRARSGQEDLSTAQPVEPSGNLSTDQATRPSERLVTDQAGSEPGRLVTDQPPVSGELDDMGWKIVAFCEVPRSMAEIMGELGLTHRTFFRRNHLEPLLAGGVLRMTHPEQPNHPDQAYVLTKAGNALETRRVKGDAGTGNGDRTNGA